MVRINPPFSNSYSQNLLTQEASFILALQLKAHRTGQAKKTHFSFFQALRNNMGLCYKKDGCQWQVWRVQPPLHIFLFLGTYSQAFFSKLGWLVLFAKIKSFKVVSHLNHSTLDQNKAFNDDCMNVSHSNTPVHVQFTPMLMTITIICPSNSVGQDFHWVFCTDSVLMVIDDFV